MGFALEPGFAPRRFLRRRGNFPVVRQCALVRRRKILWSTVRQRKFCAFLRLMAKAAPATKSPSTTSFPIYLPSGLRGRCCCRLFCLITSAGRISQTIETFSWGFGWLSYLSVSLYPPARDLPYILPLYPPLALLVAVGIRRWQLGAACSRRPVCGSPVVRGRDRVPCWFCRG